MKLPDNKDFPVSVSSEKASPREDEPLRRVRVPGTIFEVDEEGYVHVPKSLLDNLFQKK